MSPARIRQLVAITGLGALVPVHAQAQAYQCRAPAISSVPQITPDGARRESAITGYTLTLSWSPEFCRTRSESRNHRAHNVRAKMAGLA